MTISAEDLLARTGYGETSDGTLIPTGRLLQLANEADILPAVLTATGECLMLGRSMRIATTAQTYALIARDGGCSFPGCTHPPEWCDRHHIKEWIDGGETNLNNLTLLCLPPHPLRQPRLDLPAQPRHRPPRMGTTALDQPPPNTTYQPPDQTTTSAAKQSRANGAAGAARGVEVLTEEVATPLVPARKPTSQSRQRRRPRFLR